MHDDINFAKKKSSLRIEFIFTLIGTLINKIAIFGAQYTYTWTYRKQCTECAWLFIASCGTGASLANISLKMRRACAITRTMKGDTYRTMITDVFVTTFQQISSTCHISYATIDLLRQMFDGHLIIRNGNVNWTPRNCDMIPLDDCLKKSVMTINQRQLSI